MFCPEKVKDRKALWDRNGKMGGCANLLNVDPGEIAKNILGEKVSSGDMFLYLYRRFGPPTSHGDTYKSAADYYLSTPMPGLYIRISATGTDWTEGFFGFLAKDEIWRELLNEEYQDEAPIAEQAKKAIEETVKALLAMTYVRDCYFSPVKMTASPAGDDVTVDYYDFDNPN